MQILMFNLKSSKGIIIYSQVLALICEAWGWATCKCLVR